MTIDDFEQVTCLFEKTIEVAEARAEREALEAEQANPTAYPLPEYGYRKPLNLLKKHLRKSAVDSTPPATEEQAAHLNGQDEQDRRDYFMVEGKEKILQDAMNKICSWPKNYTFKHEKPVLAPLSNGIKIVADLESPVYYDPAKPAHYNDTTITPFMVIDNWNLDFYLGNVVKYVCRREKKGNELADLRKAAAYLAIKIEQLEAQ